MYGTSPQLTPMRTTAKSQGSHSCNVSNSNRVSIIHRKATNNSNLGEFKSVFQKEKDQRMTGVRKLLNYKN